MENINYFIPAILYILFCIGVSFLSQHMNRYERLDSFLRLLEPLLLFILSMYLQTNSPLLLQTSLLAYATGIIVAFTFPVLYHLTHLGTPEEYRWPGDFRFGLFVIVFLLSLTDVFSFWDYRMCTVLLTVIEITFLLPCVFQMCYFLYYGECINEQAVQALVNTHRLEVKEYVRLIPTKSLIFMAAAFLLLAGLTFEINLTAETGNMHTEFPLASLVISCIATILMFSCGSHTIFKKTGLIQLIDQVKEYTKKLKDCKLSDSNYPSHVTVDSQINSGNSKNNGTFLLVIGESVNRLHMRAFSHYERETTPWLSENTQNSNFYIFPNSYSAWIQTSQAVILSLTNRNQYTQVKSEDEISIINIANKLGFKTYWFSAQGYSEKLSSAVTVIANAAKNKHWLVRDYTARQYDEKLLDYLKKVDANHNNFVVVHLKGSHEDFHLRYPIQFAKWPYNKEDPYGSNPYDNSILYTDYVLSQLFSYAKEHLNLQAMIYFSDHGSLIGQKRKSSFSGFEDVRIPFFVYLSDEYTTRFPNTALALRKHRLSYFTNDLIFDLLCGLFQVNGSLHKEKNDISSMSYEFTKETLKTNLGKTSLAEDLQKEFELMQ